MHPAEKAELLLEVSTFQGHDEAHESESIQRKADETMAHGEARELRVREYHMLWAIVNN